jgi:hypothetical protein
MYCVSKLTSFSFSNAFNIYITVSFGRLSNLPLSGHNYTFQTLILTEEHNNLTFQEGGS